MKKPANLLIKTLQARGQTLAFAESVTGGMAAQKLTLIKGTSDVLQGSLTCYQVNLKCSLLKISKRLIDKHTAESQQVTDKMAANLKRVIKADIHAAITGLASEGGSETKTKPVGTIFMAVHYKGRLYHQRKLFKGTPLQIQTKACTALYKFILDVIA